MSRYAPVGRYAPEAERFWSKVDRRGPNDCWEWTHARLRRGYGRFDYGRTTERPGYLAHRFAWETTNGPAPDGLFVCHRCDNPPCCNPAHLFLGTRDDNVRDMVEKGRNLRGERANGAKLGVSDVREIRRLSAAGETRAAVARRFGVHRYTITHIVLGRTWRHVS